MDHAENKGPVTSEVFQIWENKTETSEAFAEEWRNYTMLMVTFQTALERAPHAIEACESVDTEDLLISEREYLADSVHAIFPQGGILEFASYLIDVQNEYDNKTGLQQKQEAFPFLISLQNKGRNRNPYGIRSYVVLLPSLERNNGNIRFLHYCQG